MQSITPIREKLERAQTEFFRAADAIASESWNFKSRPDIWSACELVTHLVVVERGILSKADRIAQKTPNETPFLQKFHLPLWIVEARIVKRKSPVPLDESLMAGKEEMLATLRAARERTLSFIAETEKRDLSAYRWKHPFLGMLNTYEWFEMIAAHQLRHTKQMREIEAQLSRKL